MILLLLVALLALLSWLREKTAIDPELSRKLAHILMGLVTLSFPWLFDDAQPVIILACLSLLLITAIRFWSPLRSLLGKSILCAQRFTLGEFFFPLGILSAFLLSDGDKLQYLVAVLALTLADPVAAFVGISLARKRCLPQPRKSIEGSLAFMLVSGLIAFLVLHLMAEMSLKDSLLIGLNFGVLLALIEAASFWGVDNFSVPVGAIILLQALSGLSAMVLIVLPIAIGVVLQLLSALKRRMLNGVRSARLNG